MLDEPVRQVGGQDGRGRRLRGRRDRFRAGFGARRLGDAALGNILGLRLPRVRRADDGQSDGGQVHDRRRSGDRHQSAAAEAAD